MDCSPDTENTLESPLSSEKEEVVANALNTLFSIHNPELRGRPSTQTLARINNFIQTDELYQAHHKRCADLGINPLYFEAEIVVQLRNVEKLLAKNYVGINLEHLGDERKDAYRYVSYNTLLAMASQSTNKQYEKPISSTQVKADPLQPSSAPQLELEAPIESSVPAIDQNQDKLAPQITPETVSKTLTKLDQILNTLANLNEGSLNSFAQRLALAESVHDALHDSSISNSEKTTLKEWLDETAYTAEALSSMIEVKKSAERLKIPDQASFKECHNLAFNVTKIPSFGTNSSNRYSTLVNEGVISEELKDLILKVVSIKDPITNRLAARLQENSNVTAKNLISIDSVVNTLRQSGKSDRWIEARLSEPLKRGPAVIDHLQRVADLALIGVEVEHLINLSGENANLIKEVAAGEFDVVPRTDSHYKKLIGAAITNGLNLIKETAEIREPVMAATKSLRRLGDYSIFEIQGTLENFARTSASKLEPNTLIQVGENMSILRRANFNRAILNDIVCLGPSQLGPHGHDKITSFLSNLTKLHQKNVKGLDELLGNTHTVLMRRQSGDHSQDISGFLLEAKAALDLGESGYSVKSLSQGIKTFFQYDILATSPDGKLMGIEVKTSLNSFIDKNYREGIFTIEDLKKTQAYRHTQAAIIDGVIPVVAVLPNNGNTYNTTSAAHLFQVIKSALGIAPILINRVTGEELNVHTAHKK